MELPLLPKPVPQNTARVPRSAQEPESSQSAGPQSKTSAVKMIRERSSGIFEQFEKVLNSWLSMGGPF